MNKNDPILNCPIFGGVVRSMVLTAEFAAELKRDDEIEARADRRETRAIHSKRGESDPENSQGAAP